MPEGELFAGIARGVYTPQRFAADGFVHCASGPELVLSVADDYFAATREPVLLLRIDPERLGARVVLEPPAPVAGGGTAHLLPGVRFPHVYGPIGLSAVTGVGRLLRRGGRFVWPETFAAWDEEVGAR